MTDIIKRLREEESVRWSQRSPDQTDALLLEAAREIERLTMERDEALRGWNAQVQFLSLKDKGRSDDL